MRWGLQGFEINIYRFYRFSATRTHVLGFFLAIVSLA